MKEYILQMNLEIALEEFNANHNITDTISNEELETYNY
jgi:hypothetical protein